MAVTLDSYNTGSQDRSMYAGSRVAYGQSFTVSTNSYNVTTAKFYLKKSGSPTGTITVRLWSHSGTYGTSSVPDATLSTATTIDAGDLTTSYVLTSFTFATPYLSAPGYYVITVQYNSGDSSNFVQVQGDSTTLSHSGNAVQDSGSGWVALASNECKFFVEGELPSVNSGGIMF